MRILAIWLSVAAATTAHATEKPNLVIILSDDQGYADLGCYGAKDFATPNIDRMAEEGVRFTDFYAGPICSPCRASLLTGCYAQRVSIFVPENTANWGLHPDEITLAEHLRKEGYATALIGKWHLGLPDTMMPTAQGFDYFSGLPLSHIRHGATRQTAGEHAFYTRQWKRMGKGIESEVEYAPDEVQFTKRCTGEAVHFIEQNKDRPFFLFLAQPQVHKEVLASEAFAGWSKRGRYGDACEELDWSVGEVLGTLKKLGLDEKTLVMYASDNGAWLGMGDQSGTNTPLRGGKFSTFEGGIRVPCIMRWPGKIPAGTVCREVASVMDVFPTFAKLIGTSMPQDRVTDGKDIWPLMTAQPGASSPHETYYYHFMGNLSGVRCGKWKYADIRGVNQKDPQWKLYDLENDIGETTDVSKDHPKVVARMKSLLDDAREDMGDGLLERPATHPGKNVRPRGHGNYEKFK